MCSAAWGVSVPCSSPRHPQEGVGGLKSRSDKATCHPWSWPAHADSRASPSSSRSQEWSGAARIRCLESSPHTHPEVESRRRSRRRQAPSGRPLPSLAHPGQARFLGPASRSRPPGLRQHTRQGPAQPPGPRTPPRVPARGQQSRGRGPRRAIGPRPAAGRARGRRARQVSARAPPPR